MDRFVSDRRMREARSGRSLVGHLPLLRFRIRRAAVRVFGRGLVCIGSVMIQECLGDGPGVLLSHGAAGQAYFAFMEPEEFGDGPVASQRHRERGQRPHAVRISFVKVPLRTAYILVIPEIGPRQYGMALPHLPRFHAWSNVSVTDLKRYSI